MGIGCLGIMLQGFDRIAWSAPSIAELEEDHDCTGSLKAVDKALGHLSPAYPIHRISLLILKARLLRDKPGSDHQKEGSLALKEARSIALGLRKNHPKDPLPWVFLGQIDLIKTQYQGFPGGMRAASRSRKEITTALSLDPDNPDAHFTRGMEDYFKPWFVGGSKKKALVQFNEALSKNPDNPRYLSWTGLALLANNQKEQGRKDLDRAASMCPGNPIYRRRSVTQKPRG